MNNEMKTRSSRGRAILREGIGIGLPALFAVLLYVVLPGESRAQGERERRAGKGEAATLCGDWHPGLGESCALDLGGVKRAYEHIKNRLAKALDHETEPATADLDRPHDAGLPACRAEATRTEALPAALVSRFPGKILYFVSASDLGRLRLPPEIEGNPAAEILVVQARSLKDLPEIARRLGRPVSLGTAAFAKALGVRCANTWLRISEKGEGSELHEAR